MRKSFFGFSTVNEQGKWVGSEEEWVSWEMGWADFNLEELKHKQTWAGRKGEEGPK